MYIEGCDPLPELENGNIVISGVMNEHLHAPHSVAEYRCDRGFFLDPLSSFEKNCEYDYEYDTFSWIGENFTCNPMCKYDLISLFRVIYLYV